MNSPQDILQPLILASGSARRRDLLTEHGYRFTVQPPPIPEPGHLPASLGPTAYAEALAYFKARSVAERNPDAWLLGADTVVALGDRIMGKPLDREQARQMLTDLSHHRHAVITGMALIGPGAARLIASDLTWVTMTPMSPEDVEAYLDTGEWQGKAGAYAIQETADRYVDHLDGSFSNVVGLPMELLARMTCRAGQLPVA